MLLLVRHLLLEAMHLLLVAMGSPPEVIYNVLLWLCVLAFFLLAEVDRARSEDIAPLGASPRGRRKTAGRRVSQWVEAEWEVAQSKEAIG